MNDRLSVPVVATTPLVIVADTVPFHTAIIAPLQAYWRWIAGTIAVFVALVLIEQATTRPVYSASAVVAAASQQSSNKLGNLSSLASIAGVDLAAKPVSSFDQFLFIVYSPDLAAYQMRSHPILRLVFADDWDGAHRQWKRPSGFGAAVRAAILPIFQLPGWSPPDAAALAGRYGRVLDERKIADSSFVRLVYSDTDPARAATVLSLLIADANEQLRREASASARAQALYLRNRIALTDVREYRNTLLDLLAEQEQTLLLSNGAVPYAAKMVETVNVSPLPTSQRPLLYAVIAAVLGFSLSAFVAIIVFNRRRFRRASTTGEDVAP